MIINYILGQTTRRLKLVYKTIRKCNRNWSSGDRQYKIITCSIPDGDMYYYVYHYKLGVSATFKTLKDVKYWFDGL